MASFQSLDATLHKNITSTPSSTKFLLSQVNTICTMNFFLGILYVCNGGWILTEVRAHYFEKRRSLATGLALCGSGIGTVIFTPLVVALVEEYGWRGAVLVEAGLVLNG